ncbi:inactive serine/threonine-protein kinase TEX14 isoform X2 [Mixophyes fleayi]|uniref:inactive serine/threonine-protein kinase TEX14 isoform X2 n=1 Tax=Mixophyes fleayi TaxID=3061075 RepID=UPI003F4DA13C
MSRSNINLPPYPVQIGSIKFDSNEKQLHQYVKCGNYDKTKKMLKKDIDVDSTNSLGQTPLFVASLLGLQKIVDLLMEFRSNPNYRCFDWSTPVHAAAFSCNQWIMSRLIDAGGDLRLHDQKCRRPYDWALMAGNDQSAQMLKFIDQCFAHMQALIHCYPLKPLRIASSRELIINPSLIDLLSPRNANKSVSRVHKWERISVKKTCSFGYGQFCLKNDIQAGFVLTIPFIEDKSIVQEDCKPTFTFSAGTYMIMTNLLWESTEVTVKELSGMAHRNCNKEPFLDLLIAEQENISNLQHPLILQLLALCTSPSLERTRLVFERVAFGSLYNILHERRSEIPILHMETIIHLLLQMIDALIFLHWRGFIHRSFSSHAIQIVSAGKAKLSNFEYMIERKEDREFNNVIQFPIPKQLYCWSSPEIVLGKIISVKSDLYSLCVVMQESLTESLPWNGLDGQTIRDAMESGHYLSVDPRLFKPYDSIVSTGIQANPDERTMTFQDIRYLLKNDFKHILDTVACTKNAPGNVIIEVDRDGSLQNADQAFPVDTFEKVTGCPNFNRIETVSVTKSRSDTLFVMTEKANTLDIDINSLEKEDQSKTEDFYPQDVGNLSATLSLISVSETDTSSNSEEEDTDCEKAELNDNMWAELQTLENKLTSIQIHNRSTLDNLTYIQKFLQENKIILNCTEEASQQSESVHVKEPEGLSNECPPHKSTDEVDNMVPIFKVKSYAGSSAIGPPLRYMPPDIASCSKADFTQADMQRKTQTKCSVDIRKKEWFSPHSLFKVKNLCKPSNGQIYTPFNERSSKNSNICKHDDEGIVTNRLCTKAASAQQWLSNISIRGELTPTWNSNSGRQCLQNMKLCEYVNDKETEEQTQESSKIWGQEDQEDKLEKLLRQFSGKRHKSQKDEKHCEIPKGVKPSRDHTKNIDVSVCSSETSYFTPELELSAENSEQETLNVCDESDKFIKECLPEQSFSCSRNDTICGQEKKSFMSWTGDRTFEMSMPGVTTLTISPKTRSIVDVEELSSISCGYKSPSKNLPTSKSTEASARHSTPVSPDKIKSDCKVRSLQENSCDTSCWTSLEYSPSNENISTKCSEPFLSPLTTSDFIDCNDVSSLKKKTSSILGHTTGITPCKSQELGSYEDALLGSYCLLNKTKQAMEEESAIEKEVVPDLSPEEEEPAQYSEADEESVKYHKAEEEPAQYPEVDKEPAQYPEAEREPALLPEKEPGPSPKQRTWVGDLHVIRESEEDELHQGAAHVQNPQEEGNLRREMLRAYVNDIHRQFGVVNFALGQVMELIVDVINFYFFSILMSVKLLFN